LKDNSLIHYIDYMDKLFQSGSYLFCQCLTCTFWLYAI